MKTLLSIPPRLVLAAVALILSAAQGQAQVTTLLHSFGEGTTLPNTVTHSADAYNVNSTLVQGRDGNFYGTTPIGGPVGNGVAFMMTPTGIVTILHNFGDGTVQNDGLNPMGALIQGTGNDNNFYGTTVNGGAQTNGTAFLMTPSGQVTILHHFGTAAKEVDGSAAQGDAIFPQSGLIRGSNGKFYGTSSNGGDNGHGTVFSMTSGGAVTLLHSFNNAVTTDAGFPYAALVQARDGKFYGTASTGGHNGSGAIFSVTTAGVFTLLHSFEDGAFNLDGTASVDADFPSAATLIQGKGSDNNLYGTSPFGGANSSGTVYSYNLTTGHVTILYAFGTSGTDGDGPTGGLVEGADGNFYGTASGERTLTNGLVFQVTPAGVETVLHQFGNGAAINADGTSIPAGSDGSDPEAGLLLASDGNFYGSSIHGGKGPPLYASSPPDGILFKVAIGTPSLSGPQILVGNVGTPVAFAVQATNSPTAYAATGLPAGLSIDATTGTIKGTASATGLGAATITLTNAAGFNTVLLPFSVTNYAVGSSINIVLHPPPTTVGVTPTYWTISPLPLPPNLTFDSTTGTLAGTPTVTGNFNFVITAFADSSKTDQRAQQTYPVTVPELFTKWASTYPSLTDATTTATPQKDTVPNLLKYLYNIDPTRAMTAADRAALPVVGTTTVGAVDYLTLTYRQFQFATGLSVQVQTSTDLVTWTPAVASGQPVVAPDLVQQVRLDPVTGDPVMQVGMRTSGTGKQFIRINVTSP